MTLLPHGVRGLDHVGLTVPDLDEAVIFFTDVLGATELFRHGPYPASGANPRQFGRPVESSVVGIAMLRLAGMNLELLTFSTTAGSGPAPGPDQVGGHHLAVYVDDLDGALGAARDHGLSVLGEPMALPGPESGPGARFCFLRTPWDLVLELVSYPDGKEYERSDPGGLHDPRRLPRVRG